LAFGLEGGF